MWFHKKKVDSTANMPQIPRFSGPSTPVNQGPQSLPQYTQTFEQPRPVMPAPLPKIEMPPPIIMTPPPEIPKREPMFIQKKTYPERENQTNTMPEQLRMRPFEETDEHGLPKRTAQGLATQEQGFPERQQPIQQRMIMPETRPMPIQQETEQRRGLPEEKPVFVKLEQYREVIANFDVLKQKIKETEYFIDRIEELRAQEQTELENCQGNLNKLKEKLLAIDKKLFEV